MNKGLWGGNGRNNLTNDQLDHMTDSDTFTHGV